MTIVRKKKLSGTSLISKPKLKPLHLNFSLFKSLAYKNKKQYIPKHDFSGLLLKCISVLTIESFT